MRRVRPNLKICSRFGSNPVQAQDLDLQAQVAQLQAQDLNLVVLADLLLIYSKKVAKP